MGKRGGSERKKICCSLCFSLCFLFLGCFTASARAQDRLPFSEVPLSEVPQAAEPRIGQKIPIHLAPRGSKQAAPPRKYKAPLREVNPGLADEPPAYNSANEVTNDKMALQMSGPAVNNNGAAVAMRSMDANEFIPPGGGVNPSAESGDLMHRSTFFGDAFGIRDFMDRFGFSLGVLDIEEVWGNPTGGTPSQADGSPVWGGSGRGHGQTAAYDAVTMLSLSWDLTKAVNRRMGTFMISGMQIRGRSISQDQLAVFNPISGQEADRSFRLFELWYEQPFFHRKIDVRVGQMDLDTEFLLSDYGGLYLNANFGWPMIPSADLYAGGPSWPLASPGVRIRYRPSPKFTFMFAASNDNPPGNQRNSFAIQDGGNPQDPTNQDVGTEAAGLRFNMNTGALLISEIQTAVNFIHNRHGGLPGLYKLGGYYDTANYPSYYRNERGEPLGNPNDLGNPNMPAWVRGNWGIYGIMDQMVWRPRDNPFQSVGVFFRAMGTQGDRNMVCFAVDAGINFKAPFHNRPNDTLGLGWGIGVASSGQRHFDRESGALVQGAEDHLELTYQAMLTPWLNLQPDFQYIFRPSGGVQDYAYNTLKRVPDEAILGVHADIKF